MRTFLVFLTVFILGACTPRLIPPPQPTRILPTLEPASPTLTPDTQADKMTALAIRDLSSRLLLDSKAVRVLSIESTLWADTSLGCPRSGQVYAQQTTPGYRIRLEANGVEYDYHTDTRDILILCAENDPSSFPVTPGEIDDDEPWMPVN